MKRGLLFEFSVNKEDYSIHIKREFAADLNQVWQAWTTPDLLDQWWAPKPYRIETKSLVFQEGGRWLYAMISPENEKQWCKADYKTIEPLTFISWHDAFCDEMGKENLDKPNSFWEITFAENDQITTVNVKLNHESLHDLELMIHMGFKEGFRAALQNLDSLFNTFKNKE